MFTIISNFYINISPQNFFFVNAFSYNVCNKCLNLFSQKSIYKEFSLHNKGPHKQP